MDKRYTIINDNCLDALDRIEENSIDCIITDPPYELNFMNKGWDNSGIAFNKDVWSKALKTLKSGGYLLAFGGTRTFHRIACAIEDAGFEIRDTIMWLYGSGFPKSLNVGLAVDKKNGIDNRTGNIIKGMGNNNTISMKNGLSESQEFASEYEEREAQNEWAGYGTALKPAYEPIIVARKPIEKTIAENVMKYGVGGINIDECRIAFNGDKWNSQKSGVSSRAFQSEETTTAGGVCEANENGRFPSNVILTYDDTDYNEVCGSFPNNDSGSAARYFYCAKASKKDRDEGLDEFEIKPHEEINNRKEGSAGATRQYGGGTNPFLSVSCPRRNIHPTVKPTELMQYLIRLVTSKSGTIMDIFMGSGSTGKDVAYENKEYQKDYKFIGIELSKEYCEIAKARIEYADKYVISSIEKETRERDVAPEQMSIFDLEV